jgi:hypothetical protein
MRMETVVAKFGELWRHFLDELKKVRNTFVRNSRLRTDI